MSYLAFGTGDISQCSFTLGQAFHCLPKPPFFWLVLVTVQAEAITRRSCQSLLLIVLKILCVFFLLVCVFGWDLNWRGVSNAFLYHVFYGIPFSNIEQLLCLTRSFVCFGAIQHDVTKKLPVFEPCSSFHSFPPRHQQNNEKIFPNKPSAKVFSGFNIVFCMFIIQYPIPDFHFHAIKWQNIFDFYFMASVRCYMLCQLLSS